MNSLRMKASVGLAGKAFSSGKLGTELESAAGLASEEKDLSKLGLSEVRNAVAVPVLDKQSGASVAVIQAYNFDKDRFNLLFGDDNGALIDVAQMMAAVLANTENLQSTLANNDLLEAQFHLVNDAVIFLSVD